MKSILKKTFLNSLALWFTSYLVTGLIIKGGLPTFILAGFALFLLQNLLKPILQAITLPLNLLTLGMFSWVLNIVTLYLLTILISDIIIRPFTFPGLSLWGFVLPLMELNQLLAFVAISVILTIIQKLLKWLL